MGANDNVPLGLLHWRLTAAAPGTLDILVDVEDPISWEIGAVTQGQALDPLAGTLPVLTGRASNSVMKGKFVLFIPDGEFRDEAVQALIDSRLDSDAPYYTWRALDGTKSWKVQFDTSEKMTIDYLAGHRVIHVSFIRIAPDEVETAITSPPVPIPGADPSVTSEFPTVAQDGFVYVTWGNVPTPSPSDIIAIFLQSDPNVSTNNQFGNLDINAASGTGIITFHDTLLRTDFELRMVLGVGPDVIIGSPITRVESIDFAMTSPADPTVILGFGDSFTVEWTDIPNPDPTDYIIVTSKDQDDRVVELIIFPTNGDASGTFTFPVPESLPFGTSLSEVFLLFNDATFRLITKNNPEAHVVGRMAPLYCFMDNSLFHNEIRLSWAGVSAVAAGDKLAIIPDGDTDLTNAYDQIDLPTTFGEHIFNLGGTQTALPDGTTIRGIISLADGRTSLSRDVYIIHND